MFKSLSKEHLPEISSSWSWPNLLMERLELEAWKLGEILELEKEKVLSFSSKNDAGE